MQLHFKRFDMLYEYNIFLNYDRLHSTFKVVKFVTIIPVTHIQKIEATDIFQKHTLHAPWVVWGAILAPTQKPLSRSLATSCEMRLYLALDVRLSYQFSNVLHTTFFAIHLQNWIAKSLIKKLVEICFDTCDCCSCYSAKNFTLIKKCY